MKSETAYKSSYKYSIVKYSIKSLERPSNFVDLDAECQGLRGFRNKWEWGDGTLDTFKSSAHVQQLK